MADSPTAIDVTDQIVDSLKRRIGASDDTVFVSFQGPAHGRVIAGDSPAERERQRLSEATTIGYVASFDDPRGGTVEVADRTLNAEQLNTLVHGAITTAANLQSSDPQAGLERLQSQSRAASEATGNDDPEPAPTNGPSQS